MVGRNLRSNNNNPENSDANANANGNANPHVEDTMESRFNKLMQAFVTSQESQTKHDGSHAEASIADPSYHAS